MIVPNHLSNSILTGNVFPKEVSPKKILKSVNLSSLGLHLVFNLWPPKGLTFNPQTITFPLKDFGLSFSKKVIPKDFILRSYLLLPSKLAENWIELEAAELLIAKAAYQYDKGENAGGMANAAKYFAAEAGFKAATQAVLTLGGMGYAKEYHVERLLRESLTPKLAPVSSQMILNYISERVLGLPKSY